MYTISPPAGFVKREGRHKISCPLQGRSPSAVGDYTTGPGPPGGHFPNSARGFPNGSPACIVAHGFWKVNSNELIIPWENRYTKLSHLS